MLNDVVDRELLILEVQNRPALWNDKHRSYKERQRTAKLWQEVAQNLEIPVKLAKTKWKNLKDKFRIELKNAIESGAELQDYKGKWPFFDMMMFTKDTLMHCTTQENVDNSTVSVDNSDTETDTDFVLLSPGSPVMSDCSITPQITEPTTLRKRKKDQTEMESYLEIKKEKLELLKNDQHKNSDLINNPDYHFLISLLPYFSEFDSLERLEVRADLQNVIMNALKRKNAKK